MLEDEIEIYFIWGAAKKGYSSRKLKFVGRDGAPDRLFFKRGRAGRTGRTFMVEFKRPGKGLRARQKKEAEDLRLEGMEVYFVGSKGEADALIAKI